MNRLWREGDLVLKKIIPIQNDRRGKWTPNFEGPYVVKRAFSGGALILTNMDGDELPNPVNSDAVKKYYAWNPCISISWINENGFILFRNPFYFQKDWESLLPEAFSAGY